MKAVLLFEAGRLEVRNVSIPECPIGGVLVKVKACGICSADAKMAANGHRALVYPRIPGHEIAGVVVESRTDCCRVNDHVQVAPGMRCGTCRTCMTGRDNLCGKREIFGFTIDGGFSEYVAVPLEGSVVGAVQSIPDHLSFAEASLAEPLACCINAQDKMAVQRGDTVLVLGGGPLGLLHCISARYNGADAVWVSEVNPNRRNVADAFGASSAFDPAANDIDRAVAEATKDNGMDVIILACSDIVPDEKLLSLLAPGGRVSVFSGVSPLLSPPRMDIGRVHYNEISITGAYGCTADQNKRAMEIIASGNFPFKDLITHRTTIDAIQLGIDYTQSKSGLKSIMEVHDE